MVKDIKMSHVSQPLGHLPPEDVFLIDNLETLKIVADPLRLKILELLRREPHTVKQLAAALSVALKKLYYHVNLLEAHGLIRVASTRLVSGIVEKQYQVTAYRLSVDRTLLAPAAPANDEGVDAYLSLILDHAKSEIKKGVRAGQIDLAQKTMQRRGLVLGRRWVRLSPERADAFLARLKALEDEFEALPPASEGSDTQFYEILFGMYPTEPPGDAPRAEADAGANERTAQ
jgi:DNA-binding transcriptional ArsR family regulator